MTTALYEIETSEADDGTTVPAEGIWTPGEDAADNGFVVYGGLYVAGLGAPNGDRLHPDRFVVLGHQRWAAIEAAAAYMDRVHGCRTLHLYPGDDPSVLILRIPRAVHTHGVFLRHPHPEHPCGCEHDDTWRMVWASPIERGAVPITAMRHPAAPATATGLPNPDHEAASATWAP
ncbi:hypothetical protein [Streptomyces europaeiscabiei]|uniref:hypothetical protein n=1 Tax=Streptomyces europaeiscabiei TaxID=146819 RepID=UPI0029B42CB1|nr:hypothetical protein [Streptomyces europaeiscabiei]MDX3587597.1 hypothetical protein [Streptomyces europaeiscabiei]